MKTNDEVLRVVTFLKMHPFMRTVNGIDNDDLAELLIELVEHRENKQTIRDLLT